MPLLDCPQRLPSLLFIPSFSRTLDGKVRSFAHKRARLKRVGATRWTNLSSETVKATRYLFWFIVSIVYGESQSLAL